MTDIVEEMARAIYASVCATDPIEPREPNWGRGGFKTESAVWHAAAQAAYTIVERRIGELTEALRPFARVAELREGYKDAEDTIVCLKLTDCAKALASLEQRSDQ